MLEKFISRSTDEVLLDVYALRLRELDGEKMERPLLTLFLGGNRMPINGFLNDLRKENNIKGIVLHHNHETTFIEMSAVVGITLHAADKLVPFFIDLTASDISQLPSVTRVDVKKQQAEESTRLNSHFPGIALLLKEELPADHAALFFTRQFLSDIAMALVTLAKAPLAKKVIQEEVKTIQIVRSPKFKIRKDHDTIEMHYPFNKSYTTPSERRFLTEQFAAVL